MPLTSLLAFPKSCWIVIRKFPLKLKLCQSTFITHKSVMVAAEETIISQSCFVSLECRNKRNFFDSSLFFFTWGQNQRKKRGNTELEARTFKLWAWRQKTAKRFSAVPCIFVTETVAGAFAKQSSKFGWVAEIQVRRCSPSGRWTVWKSFSKCLLVFTETATTKWKFAWLL